MSSKIENRIITNSTEITLDINEPNPVFTQEKFPTGVKLDMDKPLTATLKNMIDKSPDNNIPWSKFMETSLNDPDHGYYSTNVEIGNKGDFLTWPERLPSFGAHVGQSLLKVWKSMNQPDQFQIVEMGAGNGTLADSLLKWAKKEHPEFHQTIQYQIVEQSPTLIERQKAELLGPTEERHSNTYHKHKNVTWKQGSAINLSELNITGVKGAVISNELPDTFPVERVTSLKGKPVQKYITIENDQWVETWGDLSPEVAKYIEDHQYQIKEGVEEPINLLATTWQQNVCSALEKGAVLTIDYGENNQVGKTDKYSVRIYENRRKYKATYQDILAPYKEPGKSDITTDIDFEVLRKIATENGHKVDFSDTQSKFLLRNGLEEEIERLGIILDKNPNENNQKQYNQALKAKEEEENFYVLMTTKGI